MKNEDVRAAHEAADGAGKRVQNALDVLFRARWELDDGEFDITNLDDELDALAEATKFDRAEAVVRWEKQREQEIAAARAEYAAQPSDPQVAVRNVGHAIADVLRSLSGESLVGEDVHALWKESEKR